MSLMLVSGSPGAGKTTAARLLAQRAERGVQILSDEFYYFITNLIAPSIPEAREQNETVITAAIRAAAAYASDNYDVFMDGVFGPWMLPLFAQELSPTNIGTDYVLLTAPLDVCETRTLERGDPPEILEIVRRMHGQLSDTTQVERHVIDANDRRMEDIVEEIESKRAAGDLRLDWDDWL